MVLQACDVAGALDVAPNQIPRRRFVERALTAGEHAGVVDEVFDHRFGIRPVHSAYATKRANASVGGGRLRARCRGRRTDEHEGQDAIGEVEGEELGERATGRNADDMRGRRFRTLEHTGGIRDQIRAACTGTSRLVGHRSTGVAVVVADHEPFLVGEHPAEPPSHQSIDAARPVTRRIGGSVGSPKASVQSSTPFASIIRSDTRPAPFRHDLGREM